jgi:hypothetical protein
MIVEGGVASDTFCRSRLLRDSLAHDDERRPVGRIRLGRLGLLDQLLAMGMAVVS